MCEDVQKDILRDTELELFNRNLPYIDKYTYYSKCLLFGNSVARV